MNVLYKKWIHNYDSSDLYKCTLLTQIFIRKNLLQYDFEFRLVVKEWKK